MDITSFETLAHEFKTPLTAIRLNTQLLNHLERNGKLSKETLRETLNRLDEESKRLTTLFEEIEDQVVYTATPQTGSA